MSEKAELEFMMGEFRAEIPTDRLYARNHMWARGQADGGSLRFGFTAYAVRLLQDVYFLEWVVDSNAQLRERQVIGAIESKKAESDLYAPLDGQLLQWNESLLEDPSTINIDKYGRGWLFELRAASTAALLTPEQYVEHLGEVWEVTQRTIKGQLNQ